MRPDQPDALVLGAGVVGLSVAAALLEAGLAVSVYAAEPPGRTTSAVAGALWGPHLVGADDRVDRWAALTLARFRVLASRPETGVAVRPGLAATSAAPATWCQTRRSFRCAGRSSWSPIQAWRSSSSATRPTAR